MRKSGEDGLVEGLQRRNLIVELKGQNGSLKSDAIIKHVYV